MKKVKVKDIERKWHLLDAKQKPLGRLSTEAAKILMGKNKAYFTPHLDTGDNVIIINASRVLLTGNKEKQKKYYHHSGYPGALSFKTASQNRKINPQFLVKHAIVGMLPKTRLGRTMVKKLYIFAEENHPFAEKFKA